MHTTPMMRWCVLGGKEYEKCMEMKNAVDKVAEKEAINMTFSCVNGTSAEDCMICLLYTSPSPRDQRGSRMPSSA